MTILCFTESAERVDLEEEALLRGLWSDYIGFHDNPALAIKYYGIVRDMLYTRLSAQNYNYPFLHDMMNEARALMDQIVRTGDKFT